MTEPVSRPSWNTVRAFERSRVWAARCAVLVLLIGLADLVGWIFDIEALIRIAPGFSAMVPTAALSFMLIATGQLLVLKRGGSARQIGYVCAAIAIALGTLQFAEQALTGRRVLDDLIARNLAPGDALAFGTAVCIWLAGGSLILHAVLSRAAETVSIVMSTAGLMFSAFALVGYLFDASSFYTVFLFTSLSLPTAASAFLTFVSLLLARPRLGWVHLLMDDGRGSETARRGFALSILVPIGLALLALWLTDKGYLDATFRVALLGSVIALLAVLGVMRTASLENRAEDREAEDENRLRDVLNSLNNAVFTIDSEGRVIFANRQAQALSASRITPDEWLSKAVFADEPTRRVLPDDQQPIGRALAGETMQGKIFVLQDGAEDPRIFRISATRFRGNSELRILSMEDISESFRFRERLTRAERLDALGNMAGGLAHDVANVLGVIRLSADVGRLGRDPQKMEEQFAAIQAACERGSDLTGRILTFARQEPGTRRSVLLNELMPEVLALARRTITSAIDITFDAPKRDLRVFVEPGQLESAVLNLMFNARDALVEAYRNGSITVSLGESDDWVTLTIDDDGPGMSDAVRRRATDPFFTTRKESGGTGLGLATVEAFAQGSDGRFDLAKSPAGGVRAVLTLPREADDHAAAQDGPHPVRPLTGVTVLVVEDDPNMRAALDLSLAQLGILATSFGTADDAIRCLHEGARFDLLLTDIMLKGSMNGYALAAEAARLAPEMPVVYISGYVRADAIGEKTVAGPLLRKPVGSADLARAIADTL